MNEQPVVGTPKFSVGFKVTLAFFSILSGLMLSLWASDQTELWNWFPAFFCFAIAGTVVLPRKLAIACGYVVALTICLLNIWLIQLWLSGKEPMASVLRFTLAFGMPAVAFLLYRQFPRSQ